MSMRIQTLFARLSLFYIDHQQALTQVFLLPESTRNRGIFERCRIQILWQD